MALAAEILTTKNAGNTNVADETAALHVGNLRVLSVQQEAIANTTTGAANSNNVGDAPVVLNQILVALRAHGLIAT